MFTKSEMKKLKEFASRDENTSIHQLILKKVFKKAKVDKETYDTIFWRIVEKLSSGTEVLDFKTAEEQALLTYFNDVYSSFYSWTESLMVDIEIAKLK